MASIGAGSCLIAIVIITVVSVGGRYIFSLDSVPGGFNMIESILFPLLVFFGLPLAHKEGTFPKLDILFDKIPLKVSQLLDFLVSLIEALVYLILIWFMLKFSVNSFASGRSVQIGVSYFPVWPIAFISVFSFLVMYFQMIVGVYKIIKNQLCRLF
jgi:TRAP-type C4-dicarboxylate transport system permease small subunit